MDSVTLCLEPTFVTAITVFARDRCWAREAARQTTAKKDRRWAVFSFINRYKEIADDRERKSRALGWVGTTVADGLTGTGDSNSVRRTQSSQPRPRRWRSSGLRAHA